ncbi:MAG TPA: acyltransferase [Lacipirellulaceae bacterium]|jgi:peptidoglycan/LPS O-acetylase OafA/YrhL|nr:acyltransferase [Lacipirellulaceae bacterium]
MLAENRANSPVSSVATYPLVEDTAPATLLFRPRESAAPQTSARICLADQIRFTLLFLPIVLIAVQSYYKSTILHGLGTISPVGGDAIYWGVRAVLFGSFLYMLFAKSPISIARPDRPLDLYAEERSARDPLLGLRGLACLNVFFGHWFMVVFGPAVPAPTSGEYALRTALSFSPWCGVWMFFTLSGYLMGKGFVTGRHSVDRAGLKHFYRNRVLRIFPIYFISIFLVAVFVNPTYLDFREPSAVRCFFEAGLFDQQTGGAIGALWSVSTEFQFYLLAPLLFLLLSQCFKRDFTRVACTVGLCVAFAIIKLSILKHAPQHWLPRIYMPLLLNLDCFIAGMTTAFTVNGLLKAKRYVPYGLTLGIVATVLAQVVYSTWSFHEMCAYEGFPGSSTRFHYLACAPGVTTLLTCLIIGLFELSRRKSGRSNFAWRVSTTLGVLTYCLYVFHEPVLLSLRKLAPPTLTIEWSLIACPFGLLVSIAVAYIFYYFVELRFDKIRK